MPPIPIAETAQKRYALERDHAKPKNSNVVAESYGQFARRVSLPSKPPCSYSFEEGLPAGVLLSFVALLPV